MSSNREIVERYAAAFRLAMGGGSYDELNALRHPDFVEDWPQSRERIRGGDNMRLIDENRPNKVADGAVERFVGTDDQFLFSPMMTVVHVAGTGDDFTIVARMKYAQGDEWYAVMLCTVKDRRIWRASSYFAPTYEAPSWRAGWVEPMDESTQSTVGLSDA